VPSKGFFSLLHLVAGGRVSPTGRVSPVGRVSLRSASHFGFGLNSRFSSNSPAASRRILSGDWRMRVRFRVATMSSGRLGSSTVL
jgi:hypothetical protein